MTLHSYYGPPKEEIPTTEWVPNSLKILFFILHPDVDIFLEITHFKGHHYHSLDKTALSHHLPPSFFWDTAEKFLERTTWPSQLFSEAEGVMATATSTSVLEMWAAPSLLFSNNGKNTIFEVIENKF